LKNYQKITKITPKITKKLLGGFDWMVKNHAKNVISLLPNRLIYPHSWCQRMYSPKPLWLYFRIV